MTTATETPGEKDRVVIFDTTLRDGEQSPGASMTLDEKLQVAELLDEMGVDIIEAGFPIASEGDFESVREIAKVTTRAVVCGLARSGAKDIDRAAEALKPAERRRIHTFISTSPLHMKFKLNMEPEAVYEAVISSVTRARNYTDDVEWSPEDGTRTEHDFLCRCVEAAIKAGATTINIPDTVGYTVPEEFAALIRMLHERVPNADQAVFSAHCHNDLGLAVANSLAGLEGGCRQIECTDQRPRRTRRQRRAGGGRHGDPHARRRAALHDEHRHHDAAPRLEAGIGGHRFPGPVQQGDRRQERLRPRGRHPPGRHAQARPDLRDHAPGGRRRARDLAGHGQALRPPRLPREAEGAGLRTRATTPSRTPSAASRRSPTARSTSSTRTSRRWWRTRFATAGETIKVVGLTVIAGTDGPQKATLTLDVNGKEVTKETTGNGPVDAIFNAIHAIVPHTAKLSLYQVHAVTEGTDAQAEVSVRLEEDGKTVTARGADPDTLVASAKAYISAINKLSAKRTRFHAHSASGV